MDASAGQPETAVSLIGEQSPVIFTLESSNE
jgi:hypothetical protein